MALQESAVSIKEQVKKKTSSSKPTTFVKVTGDVQGGGYMPGLVEQSPVTYNPTPAFRTDPRQLEEDTDVQRPIWDFMNSPQSSDPREYMTDRQLEDYKFSISNRNILASQAGVRFPLSQGEDYWTPETGLVRGGLEMDWQQAWRNIQAMNVNIGDWRRFATESVQRWWGRQETGTPVVGQSPGRNIYAGPSESGPNLTRQPGGTMAEARYNYEKAKEQEFYGYDELMFAADKAMHQDIFDPALVREAEIAKQQADALALSGTWDGIDFSQEEYKFGTGTYDFTNGGEQVLTLLEASQMQMQDIKALFPELNALYAPAGSISEDVALPSIGELARANAGYREDPAVGLELGSNPWLMDMGASFLSQFTDGEVSFDEDGNLMITEGFEIDWSNIKDQVGLMEYLGWIEPQEEYGGYWPGYGGYGGWGNNYGDYAQPSLRPSMSRRRGGLKLTNWRI